jgi:hypothetical protein
MPADVLRHRISGRIIVSTLSRFVLPSVPGDGEALLAAITASTVSGVPEPSGWAMMLLGFGLLHFTQLARLQLRLALLAS